VLYPNNCYNPKLWFKSLKNRAGSLPAITHKLVPSSSQKCSFESPTPNWHLFGLGRAERNKSQMTCLGHTTTFNIASSLKCKFPCPTPPRNALVEGHMDSGKSSKSCALTHQRMHQLLGMWISWWRCTGLTGLNGIETSGSGIHQSSYVYDSYTCLEKGAMQCHMPSNQKKKHFIILIILNLVALKSFYFKWFHWIYV
jgi:hypothetical protein